MTFTNARMDDVVWFNTPSHGTVKHITCGPYTQICGERDQYFTITTRIFNMHLYGTYIEQTNVHVYS